jgi:hypothetical protein
MKKRQALHDEKIASLVPVKIVEAKEVDHVGTPKPLTNEKTLNSKRIHAQILLQIASRVELFIVIEWTEFRNTLS